LVAQVAVVGVEGVGGEDFAGVEVEAVDGGFVDEGDDAFVAVSDADRTVGDSYDNALAEAVKGLYKTKLIRQQRPWCNVEHVGLATLE
jgi:hypothetical protein